MKYKVAAYNGNLSTDHDTSVTVGAIPSIIRDSFSVTQPPNFRGDFGAIHSELSKLVSIGEITVTADDASPDEAGQCSWLITFETKAGNVDSLMASNSDSVNFMNIATLESNDTIVIVDNVLKGTSKALSGEFTLEFNGQRTGYISHNSSADKMKGHLENLETIGNVEVFRHGPDINDCYTWDITFLNNFGALPNIISDSNDLKGTVASVSITKVSAGVLPPFNGLAYGFETWTDLSKLSVIIRNLEQGIDYYFRIHASNSLGSSDSIHPQPPFIMSLPRPPLPISSLNVRTKDGSSLIAEIGEPVQDGGLSVDSYRILYSTNKFANEKQKVDLSCKPKSEIQTVSTSAGSIHEIQYLILDSNYQGNGLINEIQKVMCDASGGSLGLVFDGERTYMPYDADQKTIKKALESMTNIVEVSVKVNNDSNRACLPHNGINAGDFSITFVSVATMSGDLPELIPITNNLEGGRRVDINTIRNGDAPISGKFSLLFRGALTEPIEVLQSDSDFAMSIEKALGALDTVNTSEISVNPVSLPNGGEEKTFIIEFIGSSVGGNVPKIEIPEELNKVIGTSSKVFTICDGESYTAHNGLDSLVSQGGNILSGAFKLKLRGHITKKIPFNASADQMKSMLEALPNIGNVSVRVSGPSKEFGYTWTITFTSNPGSFPPATRNVDTLEAKSYLSTSVENDNSAQIDIRILREGDDPLSGKFRLSFDDGTSIETTAPLNAFATSTEVQTELSKLPNIGLLDVERIETSSGYIWNIEFIGCALKSGVDVCNDGDLNLLIPSGLSLQGCGGPLIQTSELLKGSGPGLCPSHPNGICVESKRITSEFPISHELSNLALGSKYYVHSMLRNQKGYGVRQLSNDAMGIPHHGAPGPPPPIKLKKSTSTSITISWELPYDNGGSPIVGFEVWMDEWNGGKSYMVYDGSDNIDLFEHTITTSDVGPLNQVLESGRQYQFQVRAINHCDVNNSFLACYGKFSEVQLYTVRNPRPPLPPSAPLRDSRSVITGPDTVTLYVTWEPPIDNGGSQINQYVLYVKDPDDSVRNFSLSSRITRWYAEGLSIGAIYRFYVVAINDLGRSGNSPLLTTIAAVLPGLHSYYTFTYHKEKYRPKIIDVKETELTLAWNVSGSDSTGGSPIIGYELYMFAGVSMNSKTNLEPVRQEIQRIVLSSSGPIFGSFRLKFDDQSTEDIAVNATDQELKFAIENLPNLNIVDVLSIEYGWEVRFISEAGNLPLLEVTKGRIHGATDASISVVEHVNGHDAILIYDGLDNSNDRTYTITGLSSNTRYGFKVRPMNAVGPGMLSPTSIVTVARSGASAHQTTASGGALSRGIAGYVHEEQIINFASNNCEDDQLILSFKNSGRTTNLCNVSAKVFELALETLAGIGDVSVTRNEVSTLAGLPGFQWKITFLTYFGDVPLINIDLAQVNNGCDLYGSSGTKASFVTEFLKGQANEFIIEPKKVSGSPVTDVSALDNMKGEDIFFTELWTSDSSVMNGAHVWYSDGGISRYQPVRYEEQILSVPSVTAPFVLTMDTSESKYAGRIGGISQTTVSLPGYFVTESDMEVALSGLSNIDKVIISSSEENLNKIFTITFISTFGELPLLMSSDDSILIYRSSDCIGVTEIQTITSSSDISFINEVQSISIVNSTTPYTLSFNGSTETNYISRSFRDDKSLQASTSLLKSEIEAIADVVILIDSNVSGSGIAEDPWVYTITFLEPVGELPLIVSDSAKIQKSSQGESNLGGTFVLSYMNHFTSNIRFDASSQYMKQSLEALPSVEEVNVKRLKIASGFEWTITFTKSLGNLPNIIAYKHSFEIQSIEIVGGHPTPIGGYFSISYEGESTDFLMFDISSNALKDALESLASIHHVDVSRILLSNGQCEWKVTFRVPNSPSQLIVDASKISGSLQGAKVLVLERANPNSLTVEKGGEPDLEVREKISGLPNYIGSYTAESVGNYSLAVMQLESGGLKAFYYDNQWFLDSPIIEKVDSNIDFDWNIDNITPYGRDYVSIRWWGKMKTVTSEIYTLYIVANDSARLFINHELVIDTSQLKSIEHKFEFRFIAEKMYDIVIEYKEEVGPANIKLQWSSNTIPKQIIPKEQFFYPTHISGSPFSLSITPGAADYPYSDILSVRDKNYRIGIAGDLNFFLIQAKDSAGNDKITNNDSQGDKQFLDEYFTVDITGNTGVTSGKVQYQKDGKYRVEFRLLQSGTYEVHVKTGGHHIYCGLGEENKCSPFSLDVFPGPTIASMSEAQSINDIDSLMEYRTGDIGKFYIQAKDAFGNNRKVGGDTFEVKFINSESPNIAYRGNSFDNLDGTYRVTYSIPLSGFYKVSITLEGNPIKHCIGSSHIGLFDREYNGVEIYSSPVSCVDEIDRPLMHVIHNKLHALSSTVVEGEMRGLTIASTGIESSFVVEARDKFGNLRYGSNTSSISSDGDGKSDVFLVELKGPSNYRVTTSSAVQIIYCSNSDIAGYFRLKYGNKVSIELPHDVSEASMKVALMEMHDPVSSVDVKRECISGNFVWSITFLSHFQELILDPLTILPGRDGNELLSQVFSVVKKASKGLYPIAYTLWKTGTYEVSVYSADALVSGSSYTVEVIDGLVDPSTSFVSGQGLFSGIAGETFSFNLQTRDVRQSEVQAIKIDADVINIINEIQVIEVKTLLTNEFAIIFRGKVTNSIKVGISTVEDMKVSLESLLTLESVDVRSNSSSIIHFGDIIEIEFLSEHGELPLLSSTSNELIYKKRVGETPYRKEQQIIECDANDGNVTISYNSEITILNYNDDITSIQNKLFSIVGSSITVFISDPSIHTLCSNFGAEIIIIFEEEVGDLIPFEILSSSMKNGSFKVYGNGEELKGAINGIHPYMGTFTLFFGEYSTPPIKAGASSTEMKGALESIPSIGSVSVTKDNLGIRISKDNSIITPVALSLFSVWSITFADDKGERCAYGSWKFCPANIGDLEILRANSSLLEYASGKTQKQRKPKINIYETKKGSLGNNRSDGNDILKIGMSLIHKTKHEYGIKMENVKTLKCTYIDKSFLEENQASFKLHFMSETAIISANASVSEFKNVIMAAFPAIKSVSMSQTLESKVCQDSTQSGAKSLSMSLTTVDGKSLPPMFVSEEHFVEVNIVDTINSPDSIIHKGNGLYEINYTPTISGYYDLSIYIDGVSIGSDLSHGVTVKPSVTSAYHSVQRSALVATAGIEQKFIIQSFDRFGNNVQSRGDDFYIEIVAKTNECSENYIIKKINTNVEESKTPGEYIASYTPSISGFYDVSVMLRSSGGLLATYYENKDFSGVLPIEESSNNESNDQTLWCTKASVSCSSKNIDSKLTYAWSNDPLIENSDVLSVQWEGEIKAEFSDLYEFIIDLNGGTRLVIANMTILDYLPSAFTERVSGSFEMTEGILYPILLEYTHDYDEAFFEIKWRSSSIPLQVIPPESLFHSHHVKGSKESRSSPFQVSVVPGPVHLLSYASGDGLHRCTATVTCSFEVDTRDNNGNRRYNNGALPDFDVSMVGISGWAKQGRVNDEIQFSNPILVNVSPEKSNWIFVGKGDVNFRSREVKANTIFPSYLERGDLIVIEAQTYEISKTGTLNGKTLPLNSDYLGLSEKGANIYRIADRCNAGTHKFQYTPLVRGQYQLDIKTPGRSEIQKVQIHATSSFSSNEFFALEYHSNANQIHVTEKISLDASSEDIQIALQDLKSMPQVSVEKMNCLSVLHNCSWLITFLNTEEDINDLIPIIDTSSESASAVSVREITKGSPTKSISGFPVIVEVQPDKTSPQWTTAYGTGLKLAVAGEKSTFQIQAKDQFGNDRLVSDDLFTVLVHAEENSEAYAVVGKVTPITDGVYNVEYTATKSGYHTVAIVLTTSFESQVITTRYDSSYRSGTFALSLGDKKTQHLQWNSSSYEIKQSIETFLGIEEVDVEKKPIEPFNFQYTIRFLSSFGNIPELGADTSSLLGSTLPWSITSTDGAFDHIKRLRTNPADPNNTSFLNIHPEIQSISVKIEQNSSVKPTFKLSFMGYVTEPISSLASASKIKKDLEALYPISEVFVDKVVETSVNSKWIVTFLSNDDNYLGNLKSFGNLPEIVVEDTHPDMSIEIKTIVQGLSPFKVYVHPAPVNASKTIAFDQKGIPYNEGLSTGIYKSDAYFFIQVRDNYSNDIHDGPLKEIQVIEIFSSSTPGGYFDVIFNDKTISFRHNVGLREMEKKLESLRGVGNIGLSSNSVRNLIIGVTASVTDGLDYIIPSKRLDNLSVGDWIRIGESSNGQIFSIVQIDKVSPYSIKLSSPYIGLSNLGASLYQHTSGGRRLGYQYIIEFDASLGDVPALSVNGSSLTGENTTIQVSSCDWYTYQTITITGDDSSFGSF